MPTPQSKSIYAWRAHPVLQVRPGRFFSRIMRKTSGRVDFLPVIDLFLRQVYLFFIVEHASRRIVCFNVTAHPTDAWVAQQLREATPFGQTPRLLIRDRDRKYGQAFARVAKDSAIVILKTPYRAPKANAVCERFLRSVQRECLDHVLILGVSHLYRVSTEYVVFFNHARPLQGIKQKIPEGSTSKEKEGKRERLSHFRFSMDYIMITGEWHESSKVAGITAYDDFG